MLRLLGVLGRLAGAVLLLALVAFACIQTPPGRAWLEQSLATAMSTPRLRISITGLEGLVPFQIRVARIEFSDRNGSFAVLHDLDFAMRAAPLSSRRVEIRILAAGEADIARLPALGPPSHPLADLLRLLHLPVAVALDRLAIDRVVLGAPILGERVVATFTGRAALAAGRGEAALDLHRIDGHAGRLTLLAGLSGAAPQLDLHLTADEPSGRLIDRLLGRSDHLPLTLSLGGAGPLADWHGRFSASAGTRAHIDARLGLAVTDRTIAAISGNAAVAPLIPHRLAKILGDDIGFSLHLTKTAGRLSVDRLRIGTAAGELAGAGAVEPAGAGSATVAAGLSADLPQLARLGGALGAAVAGTATLTAKIGGHIARPVLDLHLEAHDLALDHAGAAPVAIARLGLAVHGERRGAAGFAATLDGTAESVRSGLAAADALLGHRIALAAAIRRDPSGMLDLDRIAMTGADVELTGSGSFAPGTGRLAGDVRLAMPRLAPLGPVFGGRLAGTVTAKALFAGPLDRLRLDAEAEGRDLAFDGRGLDRLRLKAAVPDLATPQATLDGAFRSGRLAGTMALAAELHGRSELLLPRLHLAVAGGAVDGALKVALATGLVEGRLAGRVPDLAAWSRFAGLPLAGGIRFTAGLTTQSGQALDLAMTGTGLALGAGASRLAISHAQLHARLADLWRAPSGTGRLTLAGLSSGRLRLIDANLAFESARPGRFAFRGAAAGGALRLAFAGDAGREAGTPAAYGLRLARFDGTVMGESLRLEQPLVLTRRGHDFAFSGLAIGFGPGRIGGSGSLRGQSLALSVTADGLSLAPAAHLLGRPGLHGSLSFSANVGGSLTAPRGHFAATLKGLGLAQPIAARPPRLGLSLSGDWDGRRLALDGRVGGLDGDRIRFDGSVPLLLRRSPFAISVPRDGRLALNLIGNGKVGRLTDLLPIGEDRISGRFAVDLSLAGTVAAPSASGRASLTGGRYENFASGAVLTNLEAKLAGDRDRLTLSSFSANDSASGKISGAGSIDLAGAAGPTADLAVDLHDFRVAARDEALVTASGRVTIAGPLRGPTVTAPLTIDRADINLPTRLPPEIVVIHVVRIDRKTGKPAVPPMPPSMPVLPASLDITLDMPGRVFVRGHGLDSEWRGRLRITGSSAAPRIAGTLVAIHGSFSLLGKTFELTRGRIVFDGSAKPDPVLDITAQVAASDITAEVRIGGLASAPKITLTSTPQLPQDEILSRVLFGQGKGQINAAQGLELAQAAAALTGQDFGVLDRLRGSLGLDWLGFGSGPQGAAPSIVNPNPYNTAQQNGSGGVVSAGKYIARGVSVGVTQGVSPPTSKVVVEIQLGHHVTVDTSAGQNSGTGIGINYNFDY